jgi:hypothetical protein
MPADLPTVTLLLLLLFKIACHENCVFAVSVTTMGAQRSPSHLERAATIIDAAGVRLLLLLLRVRYLHGLSEGFVHTYAPSYALL